MNRNGAYQGVILAAGHGSRLGPFGERHPKPVLPICNRPLLAYQLDTMRAAGITDVVIVIGHLGHIITQTLADGTDYGVRIRYVEQEKRLGIAHAVGQLERHLDRPFLLLLGDIFFDINDLPAMFQAFEQPGTAAVLAVKDEPDEAAIRRNFAVLLNDDGTVRRVVEKPRHISNSLKGCGLYLFDLSIFDAIRRTPRTALRDEYELTDSIQILIDYEYRVRIAPVVEWDLNITFVDDLLACCLHELSRREENSVVAPDAQIAEGSELIDSVIGPGVIIENPTRLERCVVLSGVKLAGGTQYQDQVFAEDTP
mgnify:CR=1 FL=1